jgi:hypothetical protein
MHSFRSSILIAAIVSITVAYAQGAGDSAPISPLHLDILEARIQNADVIAVVHSPITDGRSVGKKSQPQQVTVDKCWKGNFHQGDQINVDQSLGSSYCTSNRIITGIVFLKDITPKNPKAASLLKKNDRQFEILSSIKLGDPASADTRLGRLEFERSYCVDLKQIFEAAQHLLEIHFKDKPTTKENLGRKLLSEDTNPYLLIYAAQCLPMPLSATDGDLLERTILRIPKEPLAIDRIFGVMRKSNYRLSGPTLRKIFDSSGLSKGMLLFIVDAENIQAIQKPLFQRLTTPDDRWYADILGLSIFARFAPDFVKQELRAARFAFEIEIPLFKTLRVNGSDFGRSDYPPSMIENYSESVRQLVLILRQHAELRPQTEELLRSLGYTAR